MAQHRECCCEDTPLIECLHSDKVFIHSEDEYGASDDRSRSHSYRAPGLGNLYAPEAMQLPGRPNFAIGQQGVNVYKPQDQSINDVHPYLRTNYAQEQFTQPGSGLNSTASTTGMSTCTRDVVQTI